MNARRSLMFCALFICLGDASLQSVNGQNRDATSTTNANESRPPAGARPANANVPAEGAGAPPGTKPGDSQADQKKTSSDQAAPQKNTCNEPEPTSLDGWKALKDATCFKEYASNVSKQAQLTSSTLPGGGSIAVEVEAKIAPNSIFVALLADDTFNPTALAVDAIWSAEQPKSPENESRTRVTLLIPDLGFSLGNDHPRKLILISLSREAADKPITKGVAVVQKVRITSRRTSLIESVIGVLIAFLVAVVAVGWHRGKYSLKPIYLTTDKHGKADLSTFQILVFTLLIFGLLLNVLLRTGVLSDISQDILLLLGISAAGATGAAVTDAIKTRLSFDNWAYLRNRGWLTVQEKETGLGTEPEHARWSDLLKTDQMFDIYKFQLMVVSFVVALKLLGSDLLSLASFAIPANLLGLLGLSNVVHIGGKAIGPSVAELNDKVNKLRDAEKDWMTQAFAAVRGVEGQPNKLQAAIAAAPDKYQTYIEIAKEASRMLQSIYGREGTKFKDVEIAVAELMPTFP